jgi:hypothetical protein
VEASSLAIAESNILNGAVELLDGQESEPQEIGLSFTEVRTCRNGFGIRVRSISSNVSTNQQDY